MQITFRECFYAAFAATLMFGGYLMWLWQPERQVRPHHQHFLDALGARDWSRFDGFLSPEYHDQWGDDSKSVPQRLREVLRYVRELQISASELQIDFAADDEAACFAMVSLKTDDSETAKAIRERLNGVRTPFRFAWHHGSRKPWDWKLIDARNPELPLPEAGELP